MAAPESPSAGSVPGPRGGFFVDLGDGLTAELDLTPIDDLLAAASDGFRLYELFRLSGPEALRHYIDVHARVDDASRPEWWEETWRDASGALRISGFGTLSPWVGRGEANERYRKTVNESDVQWNAERAADARWPEIAMMRRQVIASTDPLAQYEVRQILAFEHPNDRLLESSRLSFQIDRHFRGRFDSYYPDAFHGLVADLLSVPAISGFCWRGRGDWPVIRLACREQIRRTGRIPDKECEDFPIRLLTAATAGSCFDWDEGDLIALDPYPSWSAGCRFQYEGIRLEGLCIDDGGFGAVPLIRSEDEQAREAVQILIAPDQGSDWSAPSTRKWFRWPGVAHIGILPPLVPALAAVLPNDSLTAIAAGSAAGGAS